MIAFRLLSAPSSLVRRRIQVSYLWSFSLDLDQSGFLLLARTEEGKDHHDKSVFIIVWSEPSAGSAQQTQLSLPRAHVQVNASPSPNPNSQVCLSLRALTRPRHPSVCLWDLNRDLLIDKIFVFLSPNLVYFPFSEVKTQFSNF